jgi:hypothetical protein
MISIWEGIRSTTSSAGLSSEGPAVQSKAKLRATKKHIAVLVGRNAYIVPHGSDYPTKWWFDTVVDPRSGAPFTHAGAWDFISEKCREPGTEIVEVTLKKPPGKMAYVLREPTKHGTIYIKVHFGGAKGDLIVGRSFHYEGEM